MNDYAGLDQALVFVLREALAGRSQDSVFLDDGEPGALNLLDDLSAHEAGKRAAGFSVAAHARHVAHSLEAYRLALELDEPSRIAEGWPDWVDYAPGEAEWAALRAELRARAEALLKSVEQRHEYDGRRLELALGALAHLSFHFGVFRVKYDLLKDAACF